jgi:hypothetical protein
LTKVQIRLRLLQHRDSWLAYVRGAELIMPLSDACLPSKGVMSAYCFDGIHDSAGLPAKGGVGNNSGHSPDAKSTGKAQETRSL